jgi:phosphate transport system permease protein
MMPQRSLRMRKTADRAVKAISALSALAGLGALVWILYTVVSRGFRSFNLAFFTQLPTPPGVGGGGLANAIVGTLLITVHATLIAVPIGIGAGVYLAEFGRGTKIARLVQFITNVLIGVPSIIVGVFIYILLVVPFHTFSGIAGASSLAVIMLPVVVRTTEDMLTLVPDQLRESALALGAPRWQVTLRVVFRSAQSGLITGVLLAVARVSGETAPLLFTALNSPYWLHSMKEPLANLTVTIFNYAMSPYTDWQQKAWGASLLIMFGVLALTITARLLLGRRGERQ